jgi:hypothetical protein
MFKPPASQSKEAIMAKADRTRTEGYNDGVKGNDKDGTAGFKGFFDNKEEARARSEGFQEGRRDRAYIEETKKSK